MRNCGVFDRVVVNASPLILLSKADRLDLLRDIAQKVFVPAPVAEEISRYEASDPTRVALHQTDCLPLRLSRTFRNRSSRGILVKASHR